MAGVPIWLGGSSAQRREALHRRGLLQCATPIAELHGEAQYAEITDVVLTPEGRRALERADAQPQP